MRIATKSLIATFVAMAVAATALAAPPQTSGRRVLDEMIRTMGGQSYLDVTDIHFTGRFFAFQRGELVGGDIFSDYIKFPDKERTEFGKDKTLSIQINNGDSGWTVQGTGKDRVITEQVPSETAEFSASFKTSLDYVLRFVLDQPGSTVQNIGSEMIDFNRADIIEIRDPEKNVIRLTVDRMTKLPARLWVRRGDDPDPREERYGNWHSFQGVMTPLFISRSNRGVKTMEIRLDGAKYNSSLADTLFAAPSGTN